MGASLVLRYLTAGQRVCHSDFDVHTRFPHRPQTYVLPQLISLRFPVQEGYTFH